MKTTGNNVVQAMLDAWHAVHPIRRARIRWKCPDVRVVGKAMEPGLMVRLR